MLWLFLNNNNIRMSHRLVPCVSISLPAYLIPPPPPPPPLLLLLWCSAEGVRPSSDPAADGDKQEDTAAAAVQAEAPLMSTSPRRSAAVICRPRKEEENKGTNEIIIFIQCMNAHRSLNRLQSAVDLLHVHLARPLNPLRVSPTEALVTLHLYIYQASRYRCSHCTAPHLRQ